MTNRSNNAKLIYSTLYMNPDETTAEDVHRRIAGFIGYDSNLPESLNNSPKLVDTFINMLDNNEFRPNTPCMINANGNFNSDVKDHDKNLVACFVVDLDDSMDSIRELWNTCAKVYAGGGGTGFAISNLREKESPISIGGAASGPIEYLKVIQSISDTVKSGGKSRRAANLASFWYKHPDIFEFISCKQDFGFSAINNSILVDDVFMNYVYANDMDAKIDLVSPNKNKVIRTTTVGEIWNAIVKNAWFNGDPGLLFKTIANDFNPLPSYGEMQAANPCLPAWAPVLTPDGYKHFICIKNEVFINNKTCTCSDVIRTGTNRMVYEIILQSGLVLYGTKEHKISTDIDDVEFQNLKVNDNVKVDYSSIPIKSNKSIDYNQGYLIGYLFSNDGYFSNDLVSFSVDSSKLKLSETCNDILYSILDIKPMFIPESDNSKIFKWIIESTRTIDLIEKILGCSDLDDFDLISRSLEFQVGFVDAMINHEGVLDSQEFYIIRPFGTHESLTLCAMQLILMSRGVYSELVTIEHPNTNLTSWKLNIPDINTLISNFIVYEPSVRSEIKNLNAAWDLSNYGEISRLKQYQPIKDIKPLFRDDVYDITVSDGNHFVTGGVVVHNCGEVILPNNSCCDLGSINLNKVLTLDNHIDWEKLKTITEYSVIFLDNIISKTSYPNSDFKEMMSIKSRPIGIGIMGLADIFYRMKISYGSDESIKLFSDICKFITVTAFTKSISIAKDLGESLNITDQDKPKFRKLLEYYGVGNDALIDFDTYGIRNSNVTSIAPTGSISISSECSYAFEPHMALVWEKKLTDREITLSFVNQEFLNECDKRNIEMTDRLKRQIIINGGSIQKLDFPSDMKELYITAHDIGWKRKLDMQAAGQRYITLAISSTCNLPNSATQEDVSNAYKYAWKNKLKGVTVYRDGSHLDQPVSFGELEVKLESMILPKKRSGHTIVVATANGNLYITGNKVDDKLVEVFLTMGKGGQVENLLLNTLSKIISKSLQYHIPPQVLFDQMEEEGGQKFWFKLDELKDISCSADSLVDGIAKIIKYHFLDQEVDGHKLYDTEICSTVKVYDICPVCKKHTLDKATGCRGGVCIDPNCAYASCG